MELKYPLIFFAGILLIIFLNIRFKKKNKKYIDGKKIANTGYIKQTSYYQKKLKEYKLVSKLIQIVCLISIVLSLFLISRPTKIDNINNSNYSRDIFLCMDVSSSVDELNYELVKNLKSTVNSLKGERFGISIFNTSSVTLVPLTDDYDYILSTLDKINDSIKSSNNDLDEDDLDNYDFYINNYITSGTLIDSETRGSSLIGDGLSSCVYSFSNSDNDRTKIIIFSTDNDLQGTPIVSLSEAAEISKNKNITVYGIGTKIMNEEDRTEFKNAVEKTGGAFYDESSSSVKKIVNNIEKKSKSLLEKQSETIKTDIPKIPFIILVFSISMLIILNKRVVS